MDAVDITNYDYVNKYLEKLGFKSDESILIPRYTPIVENNYALCGYQVYDTNLSFAGAILFENSTTDGPQLVITFGPDGSREDVLGISTNYDLRLAFLNLADFRFDTNSGTFHLDAMSKSGIEFSGEIKPYPGGIYPVDFSYVDKGIDWKVEQLLRLENAAEESREQKFIATSAGAKKEIEIPKHGESFNRHYFCKPIGGMWGAYPSDNPVYASGWHEWCAREDFHLDKIKFVSEFSFKDDAKILEIKDVHDLEVLAAVFSDKPMVNSLTLDESFGTGCAFVNWDKVAMHYDAVVVSGYINGWDIPSVVVFHEDAVDDFKTVALNEFLEEKQNSIEIDF